MRYQQTFACAATLLVPLCSSSFAQAQDASVRAPLMQCSSDTIRGTWAYQGRGTVMMNVPGSSGPAPVPFTGLGIGTIDYQGRFTAQATMSAGGQVQNVSFSGSIQVNPDCTATSTYTAGSLQSADRLIILDNGNEMRAMPTNFPLGSFAGMFDFHRIARSEWDPPCSSGMVQGVYAGWREGNLMMPVPGQSQPMPVPFSALVTFTVANGGVVVAASTASMGGTIVDFEMPTATLQVNPDCTATLNWTGYPKGFPGMASTGALKYIVLNNGDELIGMDTQSTSGPSVVIQHDKRISTMPIATER